MFHTKSIALAIVIAACGGGTQSTPPPTTAATAATAETAPAEAVPAASETPPTETATVDEEPPPPPPAPPPGPPRVVPSMVLENQRISGDTEIPPDAPTLEKMQKAGTAKVTSSFKLCIDAGGGTTSVEVVTSSGFADYDATIDRAMHKWRYRPFTINGKATAVCTTMKFAYQVPPLKRSNR